MYDPYLCAGTQQRAHNYKLWAPKFWGGHVDPSFVNTYNFSKFEGVLSSTLSQVNCIADEEHDGKFYIRAQNLMQLRW